MAGNFSTRGTVVESGKNRKLLVTVISNQLLRVVAPAVIKLRLLTMVEIQTEGELPSLALSSFTTLHNFASMNNYMHTMLETYYSKQ